MDDLISRKQALDAFGLSEKTRKYGGDHSGYDPMMLYEIQDVIEGLPSVNPQASKEDIHREREQAYMRGYEDASKRYRTEPCGDAISRKDAIRIASGYCHWSNIPKELAKLPSVNPIPCEDAISRQSAIDAMATWDWQEVYLPIQFKELLDELPTVSVAEKTGHWEWTPYDFDPNFGTWYCSECRSTVMEGVPKKDPSGIPLYKYCPQCGCRLAVEPQESEDSE